MTTQPQFTITAVSNYQLAQRKPFIPTSGGCNHVTTHSYNELKDFFQAHNLSKLPPTLKRYGYFSLLYDMSQIAQADQTEETTTTLLNIKRLLPSFLQKVYDRWEEDGLLDQTKKVLPALVPSVRFLASPDSTVAMGPTASTGSEYISNKRLVSINPDSWEHTGIFGIDIDRGADGNPGDPGTLYAMATEKLARMNGFLFAYVSPNQGIKALFMVDRKTTQMLNKPPTISDGGDEEEAPSPDAILAERILLHKAIYHHIVKLVEQETGLHPDRVCNDPARLQFLYHGAFIPPASPESSVLVLPKLEELRYSYIQEAGATLSSHKARALRQGEELPQAITDFPEWLRINGHADAAEGFDRMERGADGNLYGFCPCCEGVRKGIAGPRDLMMDINPDFPLQSWFNCVHSSCHDYRKVALPMSRLWKMYVAEIESRETFESECDNETKSIRKEPWAADATLMDCYRRGLDPSIRCSIPEAKPVHYTGLNYVHWMPKLGVPIYSQTNLKVMLWGLKMKAIRSMVEDAPMLLDVKNGALIETNEPVIARLQSYWEHLNLSRVPSVAALYTGISGLSQDALYHPLATMASSREWDGKDRLSEYLATLPMDHDREYPNGWTGEQWRDTVLTTWLVTMWRRLTNSLILNYSNMPDNCMPILSGPQGVGKNWWVDELFKGCVGCLSNSLDFDHGKDAIIQMSQLVCIHTAEVDKDLLNRDRNSIIKDILTSKGNVARKAYAKNQKQYYSMASLIGSTNIEQPLTDPTGTRRYVMLYLGTRGTRENYAAVDVMKAIDKQQLWAQVKHLSDTGLPAEYSWSYLTPLSEEFNTANAVSTGSDEYLLDFIRPVDIARDMDAAGEKLWSHIPEMFTSPTALLKCLRERAGGAAVVVQSNPKAYELTEFTNTLATRFGSEYTSRVQIRIPGDKSHAKVNRMKFMYTEDWLKLADKETKRRWYDTNPSWEKADKERVKTVL